MPGSGQNNIPNIGGSGVDGSTGSPWNSALQGAANGLGWVGQHIPFLHHGGGSPQAPMPQIGQGTNGAPQYDDYGRITGYGQPTPQANNVPAQPNLPSPNYQGLWQLLSQMGLFDGQVLAPQTAQNSAGVGEQPNVMGSVQSPNQSQQLMNAILQILGVPVAPPQGDQSGGQSVPNAPSVPAFGPSLMPGMFNDGAGGLTYSGSAAENAQYGYWGKDAYSSVGMSDFERQMAQMMSGGGGGGGIDASNNRMMYDMWTY